MKLKQILHEGYLAYKIPDNVRGDLAKQFPPKYPEFIGHHITAIFGVSKPPLHPLAADIKIVGYVEEDGLEAFVVQVNGESKRPDGKTYHITWSLDRAKGKKPVDSNTLIATAVVQPVKSYEFVTDLQFFN